MEPLHPELRRELLRVHPDLTVEDLDEYERLTAERFTLDPDVSSAAIADIDRMRTSLLAKMREFAAVQAAFVERRRITPDDAGDVVPAVRIRLEPEDDGPAAA